MIKKFIFAVAIVLTLSWGPLTAQHYGHTGCGYNGANGNVGCLQSFGLGGLYSQNCGREITTQQAAGLWSNYCNEDCSFNGGCGCGHGGCFLKRLFGCGQGSGCGFQGCGGCGVSVNNGCGCEAVNATACNVGCGSGHGCRLLRGLFGRLGGGGCGCSCYQGCFGYPGGGGCGCGNGFGYGNCGSGCGTGYGHCGCGLLRKSTNVVHGVGAHVRGVFCGAKRGVGHFASGIRSRLGCCRLFRGCFHRVGCTGFNGGYFYDAPITTSDNFGFYSSGCGCEGTVDSGVGCSTGPAPFAQPANIGSVDAGMQTQEFNQPSVMPPVDSMNSLSPVGEIVPGQVISNSAGSN